jgi:hypothetical protein
MLMAHKIALDLNNKQSTHMARACGTARFAYNWALAEWNKQLCGMEGGQHSAQAQPDGATSPIKRHEAVAVPVDVALIRAAVSANKAERSEAGRQTTRSIRPIVLRKIVRPESKRQRNHCRLRTYTLNNHFESPS